MKNLQKRGDVWYLRAMVDGKRYLQSLGTTQQGEAKRRAADVVAALKAKRFEAVQSTKVKKDLATIGEVIEAFRAEGPVRDLRPLTVCGYVSSLRVIMRAVDPRPLEEVGTDLLTRANVDKWVDGRLAVTDDPERARRTVASTLRQARALFAPWALDEYERRGLRLPDISSFIKANRKMKVRPMQYEPRPAELVEATIAAGRALQATDPILYAVFLLSYDLALRAGEAQACRWGWFRRDTAGNVFLDVIDRPSEQFRTKGRPRSLPVSAQVWAHLTAAIAAGPSAAFVLPGTKTDRHVLLEHRLAGWMRDLGWSAAVYPKAGHELRKLQGSRWFTELGPAVAREWLGHVDVATTCRYYAALLHQPAALDMDGLAPAQPALRIAG